MIRNLQIEWMKIKNYRVFQVFSVLYRYRHYCHHLYFL